MIDPIAEAETAQQFDISLGRWRYGYAVHDSSSLDVLETELVSLEDRTIEWIMILVSSPCRGQTREDARKTHDQRPWVQPERVEGTGTLGTGREVSHMSLHQEKHQKPSWCGLLEVHLQR